MKALGMACAVLAVQFIGTGALAASEPVTPRPVTPHGELSAEERATTALFSRAAPSVVFIDTLAQVLNPWSRNVTEVPRGSGSGFVWDERGHVVTNLHVIAGAQAAQVRLADQRRFPARLVGVSPDHDLAVLRIDARLPAQQILPLGSSRELRVGQRVFAIGNPFGLDHTLTTGIISALNRSIPGENGRAIHGVIQTDAAINPGNSGGPLLDSAGRLIGVNTAIYSPSGASAGIGFAVPVDTVNRVVPELIALGRFVRPTLGVTVDDELSARLTGSLGVRGLLVLEVARGSAAEAAGLRPTLVGAEGTVVPGDVILACDDVSVRDAESLGRALDARRVGERVRLRVWRAGTIVELSAQLRAPEAQ